MIELGNCRRSIVQRQECHAAQVSRVEHKPRCLVGETHPVRGNFAKGIGSGARVYFHDSANRAGTCCQATILLQPSV
jgi:hypothetical protein